MIRLPQRISTQLLSLLAGAIVLFQSGALLTEVFHSGETNKLPFQAQQLVFMVEALALLPPKDRETYIKRISDAQPDLTLRLLPATAPEPAYPADPILASQLRPILPSGTRLVGTVEGLLQIRSPGGLAVEVNPTGYMPERPRLNIVAALITSAIISAIGFTLYAFFNLKRPLDALADAADRFGREQSFAPIPERGPAEIAGATRVLNQMQERITTMISDRTRTLAALGHDLRTPITRMRLHAEKVDDVSLRTAMVNDLDYMQRMTHAALTFLRGGTLATQAPIDVASLLQTICDEAEDMGQPVSYTGPLHVIVKASIDEIRRAVTNLVVNAVFQRANVVVALRDDDAASVAIEVIDDGPGMSDEEKARAFEPFWRGERSRYDRTGLGLGLSIVHNVARSHDGKVSLHDRPGGGLICRLRLPRGVVEGSTGLIRRTIDDVTPA